MIGAPGARFSANGEGHVAPPTGAWDAIHFAVIARQKRTAKSTSPSRSARQSLLLTSTRRTLAAQKRHATKYTHLLLESSALALCYARESPLTKTHQLVDGHELPLVSICNAGQDGDRPMFAPPLENLKIGRRSRTDAALGEKAYSSRANRPSFRSRRIEAVISEPSDQQGFRLRRGSKGGRPPKFDAIKYRGRNVVGRDYTRL